MTPHGKQVAERFALCLSVLRSHLFGSVEIPALSLLRHAMSKPQPLFCVVTFLDQHGDDAACPTVSMKHVPAYSSIS